MVCKAFAVRFLGVLLLWSPRSPLLQLHVPASAPMAARWSVPQEALPGVRSDPLVHSQVMSFAIAPTAVEVFAASSSTNPLTSWTSLLRVSSQMPFIHSLVTAPEQSLDVVTDVMVLPEAHSVSSESSSVTAMARAKVLPRSWAVEAAMTPIQWPDRRGGAGQETPHVDVRRRWPIKGGCAKSVINN